MGFNVSAADFVSAFTLLENLIRFKDGMNEAGGVVATLIDTSQAWLATMVEMEPSGIGVDKLRI